VHDLSKALYELAREVGAPRALEALGMPRSGVEKAAELAMSNPYWNPRALEQDALRGLLERAYAGLPPQAV